MKLTQREVRVIGLLCEGRTDKEIAREAGLTLGVVRQTVHVLCGKLDAPNRVAAAVNYVRMQRTPEESG